jgi:hypothetical protein
LNSYNQTHLSRSHHQGQLWDGSPIVAWLAVVIIYSIFDIYSSYQGIGVKSSGGDGYPNVYARGTTQEIMDQMLAGYIAANTPIRPTIQGRIVCTTSGAAVCPVVTP